MKPKSILLLFLFVLSLGVAPFALFAQSAASGAQSAAEVSPWLLALIPVLTPLAIALAKIIAPQIPGAWLPVLAPILGVVIDQVSHYASGSASNPALGAALGAAGVGLREIVDQGKKRMASTITVMPFVALCALLGMGAAGVILTGCETVRGIVDRHPLLVKAGIDVGVQEFLRKNPRLRPLVIRIADEVIADSKSGEAFDTVDALIEAIRLKARTIGGLLPAEIEFGDALLGEIRTALVDKLGPGTLSPENLLTVNQVAAWVKSAAEEMPAAQ